MTLIGVKPYNHPQQVRDRGHLDTVDDRWTPPEIFDRLHAEHGFTIDVAASRENRKLDRFFTKEEDALSRSWTGEVVWCNPPYSALRPWVEKALAEVRFNGCHKVVLLLPANRTEQAFWQDLIEPIRDRPGSGIRTEFLRGRLKFARPDYRPKSSAPFGCVVITIEPPDRGD